MLRNISGRVPLENHVWEICKLATDEAYQGRGAGSAVLRACLAYAIGHGAREIMLITNHILKPALHIYEKFGFVQTAVEDNPFARADVQYRLDVTKMDAKSDGCTQNPHIAEEKKQ